MQSPGRVAAAPTEPLLPGAASLPSKSVSPPLRPEQPLGEARMHRVWEGQAHSAAVPAGSEGGGCLSDGVSSHCATSSPLPTSLSNSNGDFGHGALRRAPLELTWGPSRSAVDSFDTGEQRPHRAFTKLCSGGLSDYIAPGSLLAQCPCPQLASLPSLPAVPRASVHSFAE